MNIDKILTRINQLSNADKESSVLSLVEETGEVSQALNVERGTKTRKLKETVPQETCDVILCCFELLTKYDLIESEIEKYLEKKLKKWENKFDKSEISDIMDTQ